MTVVLYDLVGANDQRFSPHCWRVRMALAHKGLPCEARATRFCDVPTVGGGRFKTIPVIEDRGELIGDSWTIAQYLEEAYPDLPSLFSGHGGQELTRFVQSWCVGVLHAGLAPLIMLDIFEQLVAEDQPQFRASREARFGRSLEEVQAGREARLEGFRNSMEPLRRTLQGVAYLGGDGP
ncbi:MAG: glutathione S-transferase family protein, partial [Pseudomonadota bacterium]